MTQHQHRLRSLFVQAVAESRTFGPDEPEEAKGASDIAHEETRRFFGSGHQMHLQERLLSDTDAGAEFGHLDVRDLTLDDVRALLVRRRLLRPPQQFQVQSGSASFLGESTQRAHCCYCSAPPQRVPHVNFCKRLSRHGLSPIVVRLSQVKARRGSIALPGIAADQPLKVISLVDLVKNSRVWNEVQGGKPFSEYCADPLSVHPFPSSFHLLPYPKTKHAPWMACLCVWWTARRTLPE